RTIWSIISSSVLTLFACIYSAIHPNILSPTDSLVLILWRRLGMVIMALITPELIVTWAMRQWISARRVTKQFKESGYFKVSQPQEQSEGEPFSLKLDMFLDNSLCTSLDHGSIAATAEQHVEGESSSVLVFLRKFILVLQCLLQDTRELITRAIYHLETTQLEVGTLAFAVLNFLTYAAWWNKPLNVQCSYPVYWK
ncbi:hypothetical protein BDR03DRAFT_830792, partial [Suillus americanus]